MRRSSWRNGVSVLRFSSSVMTGIRSSSFAVPELVVKVVSMTLVPSRYWRFASCSIAGWMAKKPPLSTSRRRPKIDGESNRGQQSQSIEPPRETSATERVQPMAA